MVDKNKLYVEITQIIYLFIIANSIKYILSYNKKPKSSKLKVIYVSILAVRHFGRNWIVYGRWTRAR